MNDDRNRFEDFFFFFLKLLCVCLSAVCLYLAYDMYNDKKVEQAIDEVAEKSVQLFDDIINQLSE